MSDERLSWPILSANKIGQKSYHLSCKNRLNLFATKIVRFYCQTRIHCILDCHFLSSLSWRDKWRVSWFNDFVGRLPLETKPRCKSWPTSSIVWRRLWLKTVLTYLGGDESSEEYLGYDSRLAGCGPAVVVSRVGGCGAVVGEVFDQVPDSLVNARRPQSYHTMIARLQLHSACSTPGCDKRFRTFLTYIFTFFSRFFI